MRSEIKNDAIIDEICNKLSIQDERYVKVVYSKNGNRLFLAQVKENDHGNIIKNEMYLVRVFIFHNVKEINIATKIDVLKMRECDMCVLMFNEINNTISQIEKINKSFNSKLRGVHTEDGRIVTDLTGETFGKLTVLGLAEERNKIEQIRVLKGEIKKAALFWRCSNEGGKITEVTTAKLVNRK